MGGGISFHCRETGTTDGRGCVPAPVIGGYHAVRRGLASDGPVRFVLLWGEVLVLCSACVVRGVRCVWRVPSPLGYAEEGAKMTAIHSPGSRCPEAFTYTKVVSASLSGASCF